MCQPTINEYDDDDDDANIARYRRICSIGGSDRTGLSDDPSFALSSTERRSVVVVVRRR